MNVKLVGFLGLCSVAALVSVAVASVYQDNINYAELRGAGSQPRCASVHFGMNDSNYKGDAKLSISTAMTEKEYKSTDQDFENLGVLSNLTYSSYTISGSIYWDGTASLKCGKSKVKASTLTLTFNEEVIGIDIYGAGWKGDTCNITINGDDAGKKQLTSNNLITGSSDVENFQYSSTPLSFNFSKTNTVTIALSARAIIGDIAFRLYQA